MTMIEMAERFATGLPVGEADSTERRAAVSLAMKAMETVGFGRPGAEHGEYGFSAMTPEQRRSWYPRLLAEVRG